MKEHREIRIKVCGMRDPLNLDQLCALDPDYVGFIFYPLSKRYVGDEPDPALFDIPKPAIKKVGVFVNGQLSRVKEAIRLYGLEAVQLHGNESVDYCRKLSAEAIELIKVLDPLESGKKMENYLNVVDFFLFDSGGTGTGGTGKKFDWELLEERSHQVPFFLSGGIGPGDAVKILSLKLPGLKGVDINSRFELSPGLKDIESLKEFFKKIRK